MSRINDANVVTEVISLVEEYHALGVLKKEFGDNRKEKVLFFQNAKNLVDNKENINLKDFIETTIHHIKDEEANIANCSHLGSQTADHEKKLSSIKRNIQPLIQKSHLSKDDKNEVFSLLLPEFKIEKALDRAYEEAKKTHKNIGGDIPMENIAPHFIGEALKDLTKEDPSLDSKTLEESTKAFLIKNKLGNAQ